jgi:hypothetical protein
MTDARINKAKNDWQSWKNKPYAASPGAEQRRKEAEAFAALAEFIRRAAGAVVSPPGRLLRIEVTKDSPLPAKLAELGYNVAQCGSVTRVTGVTAPLSPKQERRTHTVPSAFAEMDVVEIRLDGK